MNRRWIQLEFKVGASSAALASPAAADCSFSISPPSSQLPHVVDRDCIRSVSAVPVILIDEAHTASATNSLIVYITPGAKTSSAVRDPIASLPPQIRPASRYRPPDLQLSWIVHHRPFGAFLLNDRAIINPRQSYTHSLPPTRPRSFRISPQQPSPRCASQMSVTTA